MMGKNSPTGRLYVNSEETLPSSQRLVEGSSFVGTPPSPLANFILIFEMSAEVVGVCVFFPLPVQVLSLKFEVVPEQLSFTSYFLPV